MDIFVSNPEEIIKNLQTKYLSGFPITQDDKRDYYLAKVSILDRRVQAQGRGKIPRTKYAGKKLDKAESTLAHT